MKTERLYAITVYLLNHGRTSARELAERFEVSVRTVQRDIDSLCMAGIPVISIQGACGGYELSDRFTLDRHFSDPDDYAYIKTALQGLVSATNDLKAKSALEKIANIAPPDNGMILDFSVLRESDPNILQKLQTAVRERRCVSFSYTNNDNETRKHSVEPIAVIYRWYSWYLLGYSKRKDDYRFYKLIRMSGLMIGNEAFVKEHEAADVILEKADKNDSRKYITLVARCKEAAKMRTIEYLNGEITQEYPDGSCLMKLTVAENEQLWFGTLLSLGDNVRIISPESVRNRLVEAAKKIIFLYE